MSHRGHPGGLALVRECDSLVLDGTCRERDLCVCVERWIGVVSPPTLNLRLCVSLGVLSAGPLSPLLQPKREASRSRGRKARWSGALCGRFAESAFDWCGACT